MTFQYDVEGRLSQTTQTNATANGSAYLYDAMGRIASRTVTQSTAPTTTTTLYVYDLNDHIIAETDTNGNTQREYIWLNDMPVVVIDNVASGSPVTYFVHTDHLGRPARMTNYGKTWVWDVIYSPFGAVSYIYTNPEVMDIRFPGQWFGMRSSRERIKMFQLHACIQTSCGARQYRHYFTAAEMPRTQSTRQHLAGLCLTIGSPTAS